MDIHSANYAIGPFAGQHGIVITTTGKDCSLFSQHWRKENHDLVCLH